MAIYVADCPRCSTGRTTFDMLAQTPPKPVQHESGNVKWEVFGVCRHCDHSTVFKLSFANSMVAGQLGQGFDFGRVAISVNDLVRSGGYVSHSDESGVEPPEHLPADIEAVFREGAKCITMGCVNAAATMFRLCLDLATASLLPPAGSVGEPNAKAKRDLGLRLPWLFDNGKLPADLRDLSASIKDDGNDGAHRGNLSDADAEDILDFTVALLERLYTLPGRLADAKARREGRKR